MQWQRPTTTNDVLLCSDNRFRYGCNLYDIMHGVNCEDCMSLSTPLHCLPRAVLRSQHSHSLFHRGSYALTLSHVQVLQTFKTSTCEMHCYNLAPGTCYLCRSNLFWCLDQEKCPNIRVFYLTPSRRTVFAKTYTSLVNQLAYEWFFASVSPSNNLYQVLRGVSSYTRFLMREHSK